MSKTCAARPAEGAFAVRWVGVLPVPHPAHTTAKTNSNRNFSLN